MTNSIDTVSSAVGPERTVSCQLTIDAPAAAVWKALTDPVELARWFPLEADATPGAGGSIRMCWPGERDSAASIAIWEPERRLRLIGFPSDGPMPLATDYLLESAGGRTSLRVVTAGFGRGADWDEMFDGVRCGWAFELRSLRHYLERHRGNDRRVAWARANYAGSHEQTWTRLTGPGGWFGPSGLPSLVPQQPYAVVSAAGDLLEGTVEVYEPPRQFTGTVRDLNDALFRVELWGGGGAGAARIVLWLATYGVPAKGVADLERRWQASLDAVVRG
jgi:uncharacterized protein YndB with AHSA1/START domain